MTNLPVTGDFEITTLFGQKGSYWVSGKHSGVDFSGRYNKNVYCVNDGIILPSSFDKGGFGNFVKVQDANNPNIIDYYAHLSEKKCVAGQKVNRESLLGIMGTSGNSTAVHLHFERRVNGVAIDPTDYLGLSGCKVDIIYSSKNFNISTPVTKTYLTVNTKILPLVLNSLDFKTKLASMPKGSIVELIDKTNNVWYKVKYNNQIGFASTKYLK